MDRIQRALAEDLPALTYLALRLWPGHERAELAAEFSALLADPDAAFFMSVLEGEALGFAQVQLRRDYVQGTRASPVGYLEGIYVAEGARRQGIARALLQACEAWAREKGCTEFASDCELDNTGSLGWHLRAGFHEAGRIICFVKKL